MPVLVEAWRANIGLHGDSEMTIPIALVAVEQDSGVLSQCSALTGLEPYARTFKTGMPPRSYQVLLYSVS